MVVTELGMVTLVNALCANALSPRVVTELGMVTLVNALYANALKPMVITELGMVTLVNAIFSNALSPMVVTALPAPSVPGITMLVPEQAVAHPVTVAEDPTTVKLKAPV